MSQGSVAAPAFCNRLHPDSVAPTTRPHPREAGGGILLCLSDDDPERLAEETITPLEISVGAPRYALSLIGNIKPI